MTHEEAIELLEGLANRGHKEIDLVADHEDTDEIICEFLRDNGYEKISELIKKIDRNCGGFNYG